MSYHDAETVGAVTAAIRDGLARDFAGVTSRVVLVEADPVGGAGARAREVLGPAGDLVEVQMPSGGIDRLGVPYHGIPGKARGLHAVLSTARDAGAHTCVVFDGAVQSVTPQWLDWLARPVIEREFDFVAPFYHRHPYEGALTKGVVYPVFRALYGVRVRQPASAEFACSARLRDHFLTEAFWEREGVNIGIDLWLSASAASGEFRLGEASLGVRAHQSRGEDALDLGATITQVVGSLFADLEHRAERWQRTRGSVAVQRFGDLPAPPASRPSRIDPERLIESFRLGYRELRDVWTWVLPTRTIVDLRRLVDCPVAQFRFDDGLWARTVYDYAVGYRTRVLARDHLLQSLVPLYLGWLASFALQTGDLDAEGVDGRVDGLAAAFEAQKSYLIARWRWPERLRA
jgi:hypothetical protein